MAEKTFSPAEMDSVHLGKMIARKDNQKLSLKSKESWKKRGWRLALQGHPRMEGQQVAFRKTDLKEENYEKQRKNHLLEMAGITEALVPREPNGGN